MRICIVGASGKLGRYMVRHALDRGREVVGACRVQSVSKLAELEGRIEIVPGATDDREVIKKAVAGCDGVLVVLVPRGVHHHARRERLSGARSRGTGGASGVVVLAHALCPHLAASPHVEGVSGKFWNKRCETRCRYRDTTPIEQLWTLIEHQAAASA